MIASHDELFQGGFFAIESKVGSQDMRVPSTNGVKRRVGSILLMRTSCDADTKAATRSLAVERPRPSDCSALMAHEYPRSPTSSGCGFISGGAPAKTTRRRARFSSGCKRRRADTDDDGGQLRCDWHAAYTASVSRKERKKVYVHPPMLSPDAVTLEGSPPNPEIFSRIQRNAARWS